MATTRLEPLLHLPLKNDTRDHGPHQLPTRAVDVTLTGAGAEFNGSSSVVEVPAHPLTALADRPFTLALWVRADTPLTSVRGDLVSRFDGLARRGLTVRLGASSPGYSGLGDARILYAGIDDAVEGHWLDHGKPWASNDVISALVVHDGVLYASITDADMHRDTPAVFALRGRQRWERVGVLRHPPVKNTNPDYRTRSVMTMVSHGGALFAGTGCWNWEILSGGFSCPAEVWRHDGGAVWTCLGQPGEGRRVHALTSFAGDLYAGMEHGLVFRWDGGANWRPCGQIVPHRRLNRLFPYRGRLYAAVFGAAYVYDGHAHWSRADTGGQDDKAVYHHENQMHCLQVFNDKLWMGCWPSGHVLRMETEGGQTRWDIVGTLGIDPSHHCNEVMDLTVYNGKLYAGVIPRAQVWRYESDGTWTLMKSLVDNPRCATDDYQSWSRVTCLTEHHGRLFAGTGNCTGQSGQCAHPDHGRVFSWSTGKCLSNDRDIGEGWHHVALVRDARHLRLYVDDQPAARPVALGGDRLDLTSELPLLIGAGPQAHFRGGLREVRLYAGAIGPSGIKKLSATGA